MKKWPLTISPMIVGLLLTIKFTMWVNTGKCTLEVVLSFWNMVAKTLLLLFVNSTILLLLWCNSNHSMLWSVLWMMMEVKIKMLRYLKNTSYLCQLMNRELWNRNWLKILKNLSCWEAPLLILLRIWCSASNANRMLKILGVILLEFVENHQLQLLYRISSFIMLRESANML